MSDLASEYRLRYFKDNGFHRNQCDHCERHFWTRDADRVDCGEPPCATYDFIDDPGFAESYTLEEMREAFLSFFEERGHERIDPYPVAANRWRDDVLLTQASIYDFQPHVTSGDAPPPANPLVVSQPCIRMGDIDNVGRTGRHTMAFEMGGHHAFNADENGEYAYAGEIYWKERTVELCDDFLAHLGADLDDVTYIEDLWVGGGNAGPCFEGIYKGLELSTLVFMAMEQDPDGEFELKDGNRYAWMDRRVVDTGYGIERWTWMSQGTPTVYEAIYPDMIAFLTDQAGIEMDEEDARIVHRASVLAGQLDADEVADVDTAREEIAAAIDVDVARLRDLMEPLERCYAIADHCRTLAYMFGDGIVPSNVGSGYLARMVLRRTKRLVDTVGIDAPLDELVDMQAERLDYQNRDTIREIVRGEVEKYRETLERGGRRVRATAEEYAERNEPIPTDVLIELYDSHGIHPDMVEEIAADSGANVDIPPNFYALVAERHDDAVAAAATAAEQDRFDDLPETEPLYYDDPYATSFEAVIIDVLEREDDWAVVLDQTLFYPEGGGQPADHGTLSTEDRTVRVLDVQKHGEVIVHTTDEDPGKGEFVRGKIDVTRRQRLMAHHTATHIVGYAARQILGEHIRQAGAQKGTDSARLDVTHYERIDRETAKRIEQRANAVVRDNVRVESAWPHRNEAEAEYGFDLYQGGIPPGEHIRTITIADDVQACGGTHVGRTGNVGLITIERTERIQDGIERLTFAAGDAAIDAMQERYDLLAEAAAVLDVSPEEVPATAERFFEDWKARGKRIEALQEELASVRAGGGSDGDVVELDGTEAVVRRIDGDMDALRATANAIADEDRVAVIAGAADGAQFVVAVPGGVDVHAGDVVSRLAELVGGGGGGPPDFAQGGGPDVDALDDALEEAPALLRSALDV